MAETELGTAAAVPFFKLSGSGNDFIALVEPASRPGLREIRAWCRRGVSIGADGLIALHREGGGVRMDYWNSDGLPADLCLNGTRCAARLAFELGWAADRPRLSLLTAAGPVEARRDADGQIAVEVPMAPIAPKAPMAPTAPRALRLEALGSHLDAWFLTVGVPHLVVLWPESLATAPVATLGPPLRAHPELGPAGANVDFVRFGTGPGNDRMEIRTFERGVEGETLSCGTGVLAAAIVGRHLGRVDPERPLSVATQGGFELTVTFADGRPGDAAVALAGDARIVARGELSLEANAEPPPPPWQAA